MDTTYDGLMLHLKGVDVDDEITVVLQWAEAVKVGERIFQHFSRNLRSLWTSERKKRPPRDDQEHKKEEPTG